MAPPIGLKIAIDVPNNDNVWNVELTRFEKRSEAFLVKVCFIFVRNAATDPVSVRSTFSIGSLTETVAVGEGGFRKLSIEPQPSLVPRIRPGKEAEHPLIN